MGLAGKLRLSRLFFYNCGMEQFISVEPLTPDHGKAVRSIYLGGIATGNAAFQQTVTDWEEWNAEHLHGYRMVARSKQWAAWRPVSRRLVCRGVAEVSI